jgi:hypothetical protein
VEQQVQAGERHLDLRLDAHTAQHRHVRRRRGDPVQERRLADPGLAADDNGAAAAGAGVGQQPVQPGQFLRPPEDHP